MFKRKFALTAIFLFSAPLLILLDVYLYSQLDFSNLVNKQMAMISTEKEDSFQQTWPVLSQRNRSSNKINSIVLAADARPILIKNYLEKYNSPLVLYSDLIFEVSQQYGLDYSLIVAIAQQESNLCKKQPKNCFNCWGVGIHSRGTMCFDNYPEAIDWFAKYLKEEYIDKGMNTPEQIMSKYCPLSNGSWAFGVRQFMNELK